MISIDENQKWPEISRFDSRIVFIFTGIIKQIDIWA
jgi:hypothetical protein